MDNKDKGAMSSEPRPLAVERFRVIVEAYGAAAERWPEAERAAAIALLARSRLARRLRDQAAWLDGALQQAQPPLPSDDLVEGLRRQRLAQAQAAPDVAGRRSAPRYARRFNLAPWLSRPAAFAAVALLAFAVGLVLPSPFGDGASTPSDPRPVATAASTDALGGVLAAVLPLVEGWPDDPRGTDSSVVEIASVDIVDANLEFAVTTAQPLLGVPLD